MNTTYYYKGGGDVVDSWPLATLALPIRSQDCSAAAVHGADLQGESIIVWRRTEFVPEMPPT